MRRPGGSELRQWIRQPLAWLILAIGTVASAFAWRVLNLEVEHAARTSFSALAAESASAIESRLRAYRIMLVGLQGLFHTNPEIDRRAFERYVENLAREHGVSQLPSFSYARRVPGHMKEAFERAVRNDASLHAGGYPRFAIRPAGSRDEYLVVQYLSPFAGNERSFGLDLLADPQRRRPVERTRDMGELVASGPVTLISSPTGERGITLRLPVYRTPGTITSYDMRRRVFDGVLSVTFSARELADDVVAAHAREGLRLRIVDLGYRSSPSTPAMFYEESAEPLRDDALRVNRRLEVGGRVWELQFGAPLERFRSAGDAAMPWLALAGGLLISLLLAGLVTSLSLSTQRAHRLAREMTEHLRASEASLAKEQKRTAELIETLPNPVFFKGTDGRYLGVNKAWEKFFGTPRAGIVGRTVQDLYAHAPEVAARLQAADDELWARPGVQTYEAPIRLQDGARRDTIYYKATFTGHDQRVAGLIGTIIDITERKQAEKRQQLEHAVTRVLAGTDKAQDAIAQILRIMCEKLEWSCGAYWRWHVATRELRYADSWEPGLPGPHELLITLEGRASTVDAQGGVLGRSFTSGHPLWMPAQDEDPVFGALPGAPAGVFAMPLVLGREVLGVMAFFGAAEQPSEILVSTAQSIGSQIAQYMVRKQAEDALRFVATHDSLTGLPNRVMFGQRLDHAINHADRRSGRLAVLFIDLDRFKVINDTLGHEFGDRLLCEVGQRLLGAVRAADTVARLGGDEFVVLLEDLGEPVAAAGVAQKLIGALAQGFVLAGKEYHVSASIGVSTYPDDARDAQELLKFADIAMYGAKEQGRNTFQFYAARHNVHTVERLTLESGLRRALERGQLVLYYQPLVELRRRRVVGVEALLRWQHPELGLLPPASFIGIAEETGLIVPIGQWVLQAACAAQRAWVEAGLPALRMSVNLSPRQLVHGEPIADIARALRANHCDPRTLTIEITESMMMQDPERAVALLQQMRSLGVRIAIDDFGTGHSSLAYLKRLPADELKVDRSFIVDIPGDKGDAAITQAIVSLAHSLGMSVVAEGVETRAQFDFLAAQGCDEFQGYYFSKPLPDEDLRALLGGGTQPRTAQSRDAGT